MTYTKRTLRVGTKEKAKAKKQGRDKHRLPLIEVVLLGVVLQTGLLNEELHPFEERGRDRGRLLPQEDVDRLRGRDAELRATTDVIRTALGVFTVNEAV